MTTYEKFIESKIKIVDELIIFEYNLYLLNYQDNETFDIKNSGDEWFITCFVLYLQYSMNYGELEFDFEYFNSEPKYKRQICDDYYNGRYHIDDEDTETYERVPNENAWYATIRYARNDKNDTISATFFNAYLNNITFEYFNTLLYKHGIYHDIF